MEHIRKKFKKEYKAWKGLRARCNCKTSPDYKDYGGRGITYSNEWDSFEVFIFDMGEKPSITHSLDRIDVNGNYSKENCRWATPKEQSNNRRSNVMIECNGKTQNISQWAKEVPLTEKTISKRLKRGWTNEQALFTKNLKPIKGLKRESLLPLGISTLGKKDV